MHDKLLAKAEFERLVMIEQNGGSYNLKAEVASAMSVVLYFY